MKKKLIVLGIIVLLLVAVSFLGDTGKILSLLFVPPFIFYVIGALIIIALLAILSELRGRK